MKQLKLIFIIFLSLVVILFLGVFIFLKTLDINRFKDQIAQQISKSIDREVSIRNISFKPSINQGVSLGISGLAISDRPDFSSEAIFYVDSAHFNIDVVPLILKHQIFISKIEFDSPKINIIRNNIGKLNIQTLPERGEDQKKDVRDDVVRESEGAAQEQNSGNKNEIAFGDMLIRSIRINDGTILFTDRSSIPTVIIPITELDLQISNFAFDTAVPFNANVSLWSKKKNISINGLVRVNAQNHQVRIDNLKIQTDLSDLSLDHVLGGIPSFKELGLEEGLGGQFVISIHQMVFGEDGLLVLSSEGQLTNGKMKFKDSPVPFENMNLQFEISESDLDIKEINLPIAAGALVATGQISEYLDEQKFIGKLDINDIQLKELADYFDLPVGIEGVIRGVFKGNGEGMSEAALKTSLTGEGTLEMINGRILDVNLFKLVLSKLSFIPNLVDRVEENLPEKYKEKLNQKDTILGKVKIDTRIRNGVLMIDRAEVNAEGFLVTARGKLDFEQNLSLAADFYIERDLSNSMVAASEELGYLLDEHKQIHVPLKPYSGKLAHFRMYPDVGDLSTAVLRNRGREELKKVIFKALDLDGEPAIEPTEDQGAPPQEREVSPEEALIENILDMIPIFQ